MICRKCHKEVMLDGFECPKCGASNQVHTHVGFAQPVNTAAPEVKTVKVSPIKVKIKKKGRR